MTDDMPFVQTGRIFKYPDCYIKEFIDELRNINREEELRVAGYCDSVLFGAGFIPCKKHREIFKDMSLLEISAYLGREYIPIQPAMPSKYFTVLEEEYNAKLYRQTL